MGAPTSLLKGARAFARDMPRDAMASGYLWDVCDYVPALIDEQLTSRGAWTWASDVAPADFNVGALAPFASGEQLLATDWATNVWRIDPTTGAITNVGHAPVGKQNPVQLFDQLIWFQRDGGHAPFVQGPTGPPSIITSGAPAAAVGANWSSAGGSYVIMGGVPGKENTLYFSPINDVTLPWDPNSFFLTANGITGLATLRSVILVFHAGTVERMRGTTPPVGTLSTDLVLEPLFQQAGCIDPSTICYWNENVLFADEHGLNMTDGSVLRNLCQQGSISSYWRNLWNHKTAVSATVFLDFYVISISRSDIPPVTLVCDLNKKQWFRFSNIGAGGMWASGGTVGMERLYAAMNGTARVARLSPCFFPADGAAIATDANGAPVMPSFETPFYKLSKEGRKRVRFLYLSYDARTSPTSEAQAWARDFPSEEDDGPALTDVPGPLVPAVLQCGYILGPQDTIWIPAGNYPSTSRYSRFRLPVNKAPYGIAFQVKQVQPTVVTRISDLAVEAHTMETSRV